jgi:HAD superfamily hydrolase (TIGR01490 family)
MSLPVHEDDRDEFGVLVRQLRIVFDGGDLVVVSGSSAHLRHYPLGVGAQMTPGAGDDPNPGHCSIVPGRCHRPGAYAFIVTTPDVLTSYRRAGQASASASVAGEHLAATSAAFFDVDNTIMRGSSLFHLAVGLAKRKYFKAREITGFARKQVKFVLSGSEDMEDMASATEAALSFVQDRPVSELELLAEDIFDTEMTDKLIPGTLALAQGHLDAGQQVWLVTATPRELAAVIARRLGLTGALGTVAQSTDGVYTGSLDGPPLHGLAKAEAVRALAETEGLDLASCSAYSDSVNDVPMLTLVGNPVAINPDPELRAHARENDWRIRDFRRRARIKPFVAPVASGAAGVAVGMAGGYALSRLQRR